jgi:serine protease
MDFWGYLDARRVRSSKLACASVLGTAVITLGAAAPAASAHRSRVVPAEAQGHPYRQGVVPRRGHQANNASTAASTNNLSYGGGISGVGVLAGSPKVYLVFWGKQWGAQQLNPNGTVASLSGDSKAMAPYLQRFIEGLGTGSDANVTGAQTWSGVLTQYCQSSSSAAVATGATSCPSGASFAGYPGGQADGGALAGVVVDERAPAPSQASGNAIGQEAAWAAGQFGNTTQSSNLNAQYVVVSPSGTHPDGYNTLFGQFCAWHDYTGDGTLSGGAVSSSYGQLAFTNLPYITDAGSSCGQNFVNSGGAGTLDGVSIVEGHEYAETMTDQFPAGGWTDTTGNENGDKCAWISSGQGASQNITLGTGSFAVQSTWGNDYNSGSGGCEISHPVPASAGGGGGGTANTVTVTNPGTQTSTAGTAVSLQIHASDSASGQTLTYTASGLPGGLSISSSSGQISGTPTTAGSSSVTVTATDTTGAAGSALFTWTVNPAAGNGCTARQLLGNPGFETGSAAPWSMTAGVLNNSSYQPPHGGGWDTWLDGYGTTHTDTLAQTVTIPSGCAAYAFSFWLHIDSAETTTTSANDTLRVQVLNSSGGVLSTLATYSNLNKASGYQQHSFSVSAYAGQKVTLKFTGTENSSRQTSFVIDDTALNVS